MTDQDQQAEIPRGMDLIMAPSEKLCGVNGIDQSIMSNEDYVRRLTQLVPNLPGDLSIVSHLPAYFKDIEGKFANSGDLVVVKTRGVRVVLCGGNVHVELIFVVSS